jgi:murein tripeptide amidase MpaA
MQNVRISTGVCLAAGSLLALASLMGGCATTSTTSAGFSGFSYDPPGVTVTTDKPLDEQPLRTIGFRDAGVWFSNEFAGGRMNDVVRTGEDAYRVTILPENSPINNSPWYAFQVWSEREQKISVELAYPGHRHRYAPRVDGEALIGMTAEGFPPEVTGDASSGILSLLVGPEPVTISAQELFPNGRFIEWKTSFAADPRVTYEHIGSSKQGRDLFMVRITSAGNPPGDKGLILITGRQHPPEIPGYLVMKSFLERVARAGDELSNRFLDRFEVWAVPMMNPDGADGGFWRHNAGGIDLNRDWSAFNQPETRAARDAFLRAKAEGRKVWYGIDFHSTDENIFYPIERNVPTTPDDFTYRWLETFEAADPGMPFNVEAFDTSSPIAKNWIWSTFGADAVTFEVDDNAPRDQLARFADVAAETLMKLLLMEIEASHTAPSAPSQSIVRP